MFKMLKFLCCKSPVTEACCKGGEGGGGSADGLLLIVPGLMQGTADFGKL
jgi:hypothetical protein